MATTLAELRNHANHAIGGTVASQLNIDEIINEAGRHLCAMRQWKFLERPSTTLDYAASQSYINLPTDFMVAISITPDDGADQQFKWVTLDEINWKRQRTTEGTYVTHGAIAQPSQSAQTSAVPVPRLEIWPTPAAILSPALHLVYRAGWIELTDATHYPNVPIWANTLLKSLVRAFAKGYEEDDIAGIDQRVSLIEEGPIFEKVVARDMQIQPYLGELRGGHIRNEGIPFDWNPVTLS